MKAQFVFENIGFQRGDGSDRHVKSSIFGFRPGQLVASAKKSWKPEKDWEYKESRIHIISDKNGDGYSTIGFGDIIFPGSKEPFFRPSTAYSHSSHENELRPLNGAEAKIMEDVLKSEEEFLPRNDPPNDWIPLWRDKFIKDKEYDLNKRSSEGGNLKISTG